MSFLNTIGSDILIRRENVSRIESAHGMINIIYGNHTTPQQIPLELNGLIGSSGAVCLEEGSDYVENPEVGTSLFSNPDIQYEPVITEVKKHGVPVFLIDCNINYEVKSDLVYSKVLQNLEALLSIPLIVGSNMKTKKVQDLKLIQRRKVLQFLATAAGVHLVSPLVTSLGIHYAMESGVGAISAPAVNASKLSDTMHPELFRIVTAHRNLLMAYKLLKIRAENRFQGKDISLVIGLKHVGIEDILIDFERGALSLEQMAETLRLLKSSSPQTYSKIGEYKYDEKKRRPTARIYSLPELE